jgi:hypothetical protein
MKKTKFINIQAKTEGKNGKERKRNQEGQAW